MSTKAVIFDLDDTLASEISYCMSGYDAVAEYITERGYTNKKKDAVREELIVLFNEDHKNVFNRFLLSNGLGDDKERVMELVDCYRGHFPEISYYDDVMPLLKTLHDLGIIKGILSDGYALTQRQKVKALGAEKDFDVIILTDEMGREAWKPSPAGFEAIEERFSLKNTEIMYVGDNPEKDFYLSETAGIKTVRIIRENGVYASRDYYKGVREDFRIGSLMEIPELL